MPKLSVIQSVYNRNPLIAESNRLNLFALNQVGADYEFIIFNDHGDVEIKEDLKDVLKNPRVVYVYSDINYGKGVCSGGWVGGMQYMHGELIHFANQDDIYTPLFYTQALTAHEDALVMMTHANAFKVNEDLLATDFMINPIYRLDYYTNPFEQFKFWFGVGANGTDEVTRANNFVLAPSVIYKKTLHELIGPPDTDTYFGAADFEYWARILFHGYKCRYFNEPSWLYRVSQHSTSIKVTDAKDQTINWNVKIQEKYSRLYNERKGTQCQTQS